MRKAFLLAWALTSPAAFAAPCSTPGLILTPRIALQGTASGTLRLHYEDSLDGYGPQFGAPTVSMSGNTVAITQAVRDNVPPALPAPPAIFCDAEDVDLPALDAGIYSVVVTYVITIPFSDGPPLQLAGAAGFILGPDLDVQCTTTRTFSTVPAVPVNGSKVTLKAAMMITGDYIGTDVVRSGDSFNVTDNKDTEHPAKYVPYCLRSSVIVGPLPTGTYSVQWMLNDLGMVRPDWNSSFSFRVVSGTRRHAAL